MAQNVKEEKRKKQKEATSLVGTRGRTFQGSVVKIIGTRAVVEFERTIYVSKYERFMRKKTRLHARIPPQLKVNMGDYVSVRECRPLSKIIRFIVLEILRNTKNKKTGAKSNEIN